MNNNKGIFQSCGAIGRLCIFRSEEGMEGNEVSEGRILKRVRDFSPSCWFLSNTGEQLSPPNGSYHDVLPITAERNESSETISQSKFISLSIHFPRLCFLQWQSQMPLYRWNQEPRQKITKVLPCSVNIYYQIQVQQG